MKKLLLSSLFIGMVCSLTYAQTKTYAITSEKQGEYLWTAIRVLDFQTGQYTKTLISNTVKQDLQLRSSNSSLSSNNFITGKGVAAAAYDKTNNRLYFSEMMGNDLKYIDLANSTQQELNVGVAINEQFSTGNKNADESNIITRMAFSKSGLGYALTNDANTLIQFTTDANPTITNLGALRDSRKNKSISIHTQCTSWGGDLIGDDYGNLYLISMRNNVFKIYINTMEAEFIGTISNLPATFTTNGAAADDEGNILLSSAVNSDNYFRVNPSTLEATAIKAGNEMFSVSDLANGNLVFQRKPTLTNDIMVTENAVIVYPNPVINKNININFNKLQSGSYVIEVADINGKLIKNKNININGATSERISLDKSAAGIYLLRVVDTNGKTVYTKKIVME
ncbi:MAG: T9SS type A sorting domain-containing protein [Chitinophagaceae bacterium]|nr:T9SS type A sorting domain-containing protein [Chitinophagaceae bacterium]